MKEPSKPSTVEPERIKCQCPCHANPEIKHVMPCCENGYIEKPSWGTDYEVNKWLQSVDKDVYSLVTELRDIFKNDPGTKGKMLASKAVESYLFKSKPALIGERSAEEIFNEFTHLSLVQRQWHERDIIRAMEEYASQFKAKAETLLWALKTDAAFKDRDKLIAEKLGPIFKAKEDSLPEATQDPCRNCRKTLREQMKGCNIITCYRQFLKVESKEDNKAFEISTLQTRIAELEKENAELDAAETEWFKSCVEYQKENDALIVENCDLESRLRSANEKIKRYEDYCLRNGLQGL